LRIFFQIIELCIALYRDVTSGVYSQ
jgi:hypothetical protein